MLERAGLVGSCAPLTAPAPPSGQWWECRPGELTGDPDLCAGRCTRGGMRGDVRYWLCPTALRRHGTGAR